MEDGGKGPEAVLVDIEDKPNQTFLSIFLINKSIQINLFYFYLWINWEKKIVFNLFPNGIESNIGNFLTLDLEWSNLISNQAR